MLVTLVKIFVSGALAYIILGVLGKKYLSKLSLVVTVLMIISVLSPYLTIDHKEMNKVKNIINKTDNIVNKLDKNKAINYGTKDDINLDKIRQFKKDVENNKWFQFGLPKE